MPIFSGRGSPVAALQFLPPDAQCERRRLGVGLAVSEVVCLMTRRVRPRAVALLLQHLRQALVRLDRVRPQPDGLLELAKCLVGPSAGFQQRAEHVVRIGGVLVALDGFLEQLFGLAGPAGLPEDHAQRERRIAEM